MQLGVAGTAIAEAVDQPGIAVIGKEDGFVGTEQGVEGVARQAVGMLLLGLQGHQVDDVDEAHLELWRQLPQEGDGRQHFQGRHIPAAARTMSGSPVWSLQAHSQRPMPALAWSTAASMSSHCSSGCLPATMTFTRLRLFRHWAVT